eukprot:Skav203711  [mRNA]  locus=scaffold259:526110:533101:- [translate_table: standard]
MEPLLGHELLNMGGAQLMALTLQMAVRCQQLEEDVGQSLGFILGLPEALQLFDGLGQRGVRGVRLGLRKVTLAKDAWRNVLTKHGAKEAASLRIGELVGDRRLEKYCVWFLAALAGMPFVVQELQRHLQREAVVDACMCAIIDILDDDLASWHRVMLSSSKTLWRALHFQAELGEC